MVSGTGGRGEDGEPRKMEERIVNKEKNRVGKVYKMSHKKRWVFVML